MGNVGWYWRTLCFFCQWGSILYLRVRCHGLHNVPREGGVILVSNHQSFFDPVLVAMALPRESCYMARDTLFHNRFFGRLIASLNAFPVKRGTADLAAVKESLRRLKAGMSLVLFPEGTRSDDGRIKPLLPGLGAIARKARVPVVPTLVDGASRCWPRECRFPRPGNVIIQYGEPIPPEALAGRSADEITDLLRERLIVMQQALHSRLPERRLQ